MHWLEALVPGSLGLVLVSRPEAMFRGSKVDPTPAKLRMLRAVGIVLLVVAALYLALAFFEASLGT